MAAMTPIQSKFIQAYDYTSYPPERRWPAIRRLSAVESRTIEEGLNRFCPLKTDDKAPLANLLASPNKIGLGVFTFSGIVIALLAFGVLKAKGLSLAIKTGGLGLFFAGCVGLMTRAKQNLTNIDVQNFLPKLLPDATIGDLNQNVEYRLLTTVRNRKFRAEMAEFMALQRLNPNP